MYIVLGKREAVEEEKHMRVANDEKDLHEEKRGRRDYEVFDAFD